MKLRHLIISATLMLITTSSLAASDTLTEARQKITEQYILDLQKADYQHIVSLFDKNGFVVSNSRGKVDAKEFFYNFLPQIVSAKTELHQNFSGSNNNLAARFHFNFKLKDGYVGEGEYMDEFVFTENSDKLAAVYMFENLKF